MDDTQCQAKHPVTGQQCQQYRRLVHREHHVGSLLWDTDDESVYGAWTPDNTDTCTLPANHSNTHHESGGRVWRGEPVPLLSWERGPLCDLSTTVDKLTLRLRELEKRLSPPDAKPVAEPKTCTARLNLSSTEFACVRPRGHVGDHADGDGDGWNIRYT